MASPALRISAIFIVLGSLIAIAGGCGGKTTTVCPGTCCGPTSDACFAQQYVYAMGLDGQVTGFPVNFGTGALSSPTSTTGPKMSLGMAALGNQFLYASNPPFTGTTAAIDAWSINSGTGALTPIPGSPFALGTFSFPTGLAARPAGTILYVADTLQIDAFQADATGALTPVTGSPFASGANLFLTVDPQSRFLFASDFDPPGSVWAFTIDSTTDGLMPVAGSPFAIIPGFVGSTQPAQIAVDSTGSFVYVTLTATNQVAAFSILTPSGALNPVPGSPFATAPGPLALTTINQFLYVSNGTLSGYSIDPGSGVLTPLAGSPFAIRSGAITSDPSGRFLYAASAAGMTAFSIDPTTGGLTQIGSAIPYAGATVLTFVQ